MHDCLREHLRVYASWHFSPALSSVWLAEHSALLRYCTYKVIQNHRRFARLNIQGLNLTVAEPFRNRIRSLFCPVAPTTPAANNSRAFPCTFRPSIKHKTVFPPLQPTASPVNSSTLTDIAWFFQPQAPSAQQNSAMPLQALPRGERAWSSVFEAPRLNAFRTTRRRSER